MWKKTERIFCHFGVGFGYVVFSRRWRGAGNHTAGSYFLGYAPFSGTGRACRIFSGRRGGDMELRCAQNARQTKAFCSEPGGID